MPAGEHRVNPVCCCTSARIIEQGTNHCCSKTVSKVKGSREGLFYEMLRRKQHPNRTQSIYLCVDIAVTTKLLPCFDCGPLPKEFVISEQHA